MLVVELDQEAVLFEYATPSWKQVGRVPIGGVGLDQDYGLAIDARPDGIYRYQTRPGFERCDGAPAYLFAEGWNGTKFQRLAKIPTGVPDNAPVIAARVDHGDRGPTPLLYQARFASHEPGASDAGALGIPTELDDGKPRDVWREELAASAGEGQFFTFEPRVATAQASELRIVPGNPTSASTMKAFNRPHRIAIVSAQGAWQIELPDAAADSLGTAYVVDLPTPIAGCVTVVIESTYGSVRAARPRSQSSRCSRTASVRAAARQRSRTRSRPATMASRPRREHSRGAARPASRRSMASSRRHDPPARGAARRRAASRRTIRPPVRSSRTRSRRAGSTIRSCTRRSQHSAHSATPASYWRWSPAICRSTPRSPRCARSPRTGDQLVELAGGGPREVRHAVIELLTGIAMATLAHGVETDLSARSRRRSVARDHAPRARQSRRPTRRARRDDRRARRHHRLRAPLSLDRRDRDDRRCGRTRRARQAARDVARGIAARRLRADRRARDRRQPASRSARADARARARRRSGCPARGAPRARELPTPAWRARGTRPMVPMASIARS